jgi:hypothetical protein
LVTVELEATARRAWDHSPTFRTQCWKLAAAGAVVVVRTAASNEVWRASSSIGVSSEGTTVARVSVGARGDPVELLAHEIEHVLERIDGVNYLIDARRGVSTVLLPGGAFETRRAINVGRLVADEVGHAARSTGARHRSGSNREAARDDGPRSAHRPPRPGNIP